MNKFFTPLIIFIIAINFILFSIFVQAETGLEDTAFYEDTDIDPIALTGCDDGCNYENGILTLTDTASLTLTEIPDGLIIETNGAIITLPTGSTLLGGTLYTSSMKYKDGLVELKTDSDASLDLDFQDSSVQYGKSATIYGNGEIRGGQITFMESAEISLSGNENVMFVENVYDPIFVTQISQEGMDISTLVKGTTVLQAPIHDDTKIGTSTNYISLEGDGDFFITQDSVICQSDCNYDITGNPELYIFGNALAVEKELRDKSKKVFAVGYSKQSTRTVSFNGGDQHVFEGIPFATESSLIFSAGFPKTIPQSVDGMYLNTEKAAVQVFFEKPSAVAGNYIIVADTFVRMSGTGYGVAFGDVGGSNPSTNFPISFTEQNKYIPHQEGSSYRLAVNMDGGELVYYNNEIRITQPGVGVLNGVNAFDYHAGEEVPVEYDYSYTPCTQTPIGDNIHASCGEVDINMYDGGTVNVVQEVGTGYSVEHNPSTLEFVTPARQITKDNGIVVAYPAASHQYELDTGKIYILGYKGGAAAEGLVGGDIVKSFNEWGHAGLLYYKDGQWQVAEENGVSANINPFEDSLFGEHLNGVFEVQVDDIAPIIAAAEQVAGVDYKGYHKTSDVLNYFSESYTCSSFCAFTLSASPEVEDPVPRGVSFRDYTDNQQEVGFIEQAIGTIAGAIEVTPRSLIVGNPLLREIPNLAETTNEGPVVKEKIK
ncbi:MAG: hypothetical protein WC254_05670 [Candidatus Woesearchaeota archaeon]